MTGVDGVFHCAAWQSGVPAPPRWPTRPTSSGTATSSRRCASRIPEAATPAPWRCSPTPSGACPTRPRYDGPHTSVDDREWQAHYEVALPMMAKGLPLRHRPARRGLRPGRHQRPAIDVGESPARPPAGGAGPHRLLLGLRRQPRGTCWRWPRGASARATSSPPIGTPWPRRHREIAARLSKRARAAAAPAAVHPAGRLAADAPGQPVRHLPRAQPRGSARAGRVTYLGDPAKARGELGFSTRSLEEGLQQHDRARAARPGTAADGGNRPPLVLRRPRRPAAQHMRSSSPPPHQRPSPNCCATREQLLHREVIQEEADGEQQAQRGRDARPHPLLERLAVGVLGHVALDALAQPAVEALDVWRP